MIKLKFVKKNEKRTLGNWTAGPYTFESGICNNDSNKVLKVRINNNNNNNNNNNKISK